MLNFTEAMASLDERRKAAGITAQELAQAAKVDQVTFSRWKNGHQIPRTDVWLATVAALENLIAQKLARLTAIQQGDINGA